MNARNASRERRRALAKKNYLANEIALLVYFGRIPPHEKLVEWRQAVVAAGHVDTLTRFKNVSASEEHSDAITK